LAPLQERGEGQRTGPCFALAGRLVVRENAGVLLFGRAVLLRNAPPFSPVHDPPGYAGAGRYDVPLFSSSQKETIMVITLGPDLEAALKEAARQRGVAPEELALNALREQFMGVASSLQPRDEWERGLLEAARDCGVSLPDSALSSEGLYD
jgi:hypothetical protein